MKNERTARVRIELSAYAFASRTMQHLNLAAPPFLAVLQASPNPVISLRYNRIRHDCKLSSSVDELKARWTD